MPNITVTESDLLHILSSLVASVSLLKAGGKKAAPSDKMFNQMIKDYEGSIELGRHLIKTNRKR